MNFRNNRLRNRQVAQDALAERAFERARSEKEQKEGLPLLELESDAQTAAAAAARVADQFGISAFRQRSFMQPQQMAVFDKPPPPPN